MPKIRHIGYRVEDTEGMAKFLIEAFDMRIANRRANDVIDMSDGSINLTLIPCDLRGVVVPPGITHIGFTGQDNECAKRRVIAAGGVQRNTIEFSGAFYEVKFDGPQGMVVDVGHWDGAAELNESEAGGSAQRCSSDPKEVLQNPLNQQAMETNMSREKTVKITASDGFTLDAFEVRANGESRGGLVLLQEIFGVTDQMKDVARFFAEHGYDAIVPALFDRTAPDTVVQFTEPERGRQLAMGLDKSKVVLDVEAAMKQVDNAKGVSALGYCWGGGVLVRCAMELHLRGAIAYYGTALPTYLGRTPLCPLLFHFGATDPNSTPQIIETVKKALPSAETHVYEAGHAFANEQRPAVYVKAAADTANQRSVDFLDRVHAA